MMARKMSDAESSVHNQSLYNDRGIMKRDFNKIKHKFAENYQIVSEQITQ